MKIQVEITNEDLFNEYFVDCHGKTLLQPEWYMEDHCLIIPIYQELIPFIKKHKDCSIEELFEIMDSNEEYVLPWDLDFFKQLGKVNII